MPQFWDYHGDDVPPWCSGVHCPWCFLGLPPASHGDLKVAGCAALKRRSFMLEQSGHLGDPSMLSPHWRACLGILGLCVAQVQLLQPGPTTDDIIRDMHRDGSLSIVPSDPPLPLQAEVEAPPTKRMRAKPSDWWRDPLDADWRRAPGCPQLRGWSRTIKVQGFGVHWHYLDEDSCLHVLAFYDQAMIGDTLKSVAQPDGQMRDYEFEGGCTLTQWNPRFPDRRPRLATVMYATDLDISG